MGRFFVVLIFLGVVGAAAWFIAPRLLTRPAAIPATRFFVVGDNHGPKQVYKELLQKAKAQGASFAINLADLTEHGTAAELQDVLALEQAVGLPVEHVIGSHDIKSDPSRATWRRVIGAPYRSFDRDGAHFVLLDNADRTVGFPDEELAWLKKDLAAAKGRPVFLFYHRPFGLPLEKFFGDDETPTSRKTNEAFRSILREFKPRLIVTGHVHFYLPYTLEGVESYVTGGGGDPTQTILGGAGASFFHGLLVTLGKDGPTVSVLKLRE